MPWAVLYNYTHVFLFHRGTGEMQELDLGHGELPYQKRWATCAKWSPHGDKIAFLVTTNQKFPLLYSEIGIFDVASQELHLIPDNFLYIYDLTWAPDNRQLLIMPDVGDQDGWGLIQLFMVDTLTEKFTHIPALPDTAVIAGGCRSLVWSPSPNQMGIRYTDIANEVNTGWYKIAITTP